MGFVLRYLCFFFLVSIFLNTFASPIRHLCHPDQRDALLEFKNEFKLHNFECFSEFYYPKTKSWEPNIDCCYWDGIICDAKLGKVIELDLTASCLHGRLESNSSLFRLINLQSLSLSYNSFIASPIPTEFNKLMRLEKLELSHSDFSGQIPTEILQLTKLVSLDLSSFSSLSIDNSFLPLLAQNLRNLRDLDMTYVNISSKIPHEFSYMRSLRSLSFEGCNLYGEFPKKVLLIPHLESLNLEHNPNLRGNFPDFHGNNSLLKLRLSYTSFSGNIPDSIANLKHLTTLTLSSSNFSGKIPFSVGNLSHLTYLLLSSNKLVGEVPSSISNLKQLQIFGVGDNKLTGNFPVAILNLTKLSFIDLCSNHFTGSLPPNITKLSNLNLFSACHNSFVGPIPSSIFNLPSLSYLELDHNQLTDLVRIETISSLPNNLQFLLLGNNNFNSTVDLNVFTSFKFLDRLSLSGIPISTQNISYHSGFLSHLTALYLSGCNITEFPEFIRNHPNLFSLDLSDNKIKGHVPDWLWKLPKLSYVNLSRNSLSGFKGSLNVSHGSQLSIVDLSSNSF